MRTGAEYLRSLNDGRRVFVDGESVKNVTAHPAFRQADPSPTYSTSPPIRRSASA